MNKMLMRRLLVISFVIGCIGGIFSEFTYADEIFLEACRKGELDTVQRILDQGVSPDTSGRWGMTCLSWAAVSQRIEIVKLLLSRGANPNKPSNSSWTPLIRAAQNGNTEIVRALLEKGADRMAKNKNGNRAWQFVPIKNEALEQLLCPPGPPALLPGGDGGWSGPQDNGRFFVNQYKQEENSVVMDESGENVRGIRIRKSFCQQERTEGSSTGKKEEGSTPGRR